MSIQRHVMQLFINQLASKLARKPQMINPSMTVTEACKKLQQEKIGSLVVSEDGETISGIFTERDLLMKCAAPPQDLSKVIVRDIMTQNVRTIDAKQGVARAIFEMSVGGFRHLPVVGSGKKIVGMLSTKTIVDYIFKQLQKLNTLEDGEPKKISNSDVENFLNSKITILNAQKPLTIEVTASTESALKVLRDNNIGAVLIVEDKRLKGIFTERDYLMKSVFQDQKNAAEPITSFMTENPTFLFNISDIEDAFAKLSLGGFRHLPIISNANVPTGIVSSRNFLKYLSTAIIDDLNNRDS